MSTTSTLVAQDCTLGNESELLNCICVLILARGDGTPFNTASIQEEHIIELCVKVGQRHPKGVLWLLVMESVILFQSSDEMMAISSPRPWLGMRNLLNFILLLLLPT